MNRNPRHWLLISRRGEGKSTFAAAMSPEYLVGDLDGRWKEQEDRAPGKSHVIKENRPVQLVKAMDSLLPSLFGKVQTVIYDSGTAVLDFVQAMGRLQADEAKASKTKFNNDTLNRQKADIMRALRLAALKWQCDVLWIFHIEDGMKEGKATERTTISKIEMDRMKANLNAVLTIVRDKNGTRGIRVEWCRYNNDAAAGQIVWDTEGNWRGVPEKLDTFLVHYTGREGYAGNAYSGDWLFAFLKGKGREFADVHDMYIKLDVKEEPHWFDRARWATYVEKALQ